MALSAVKGTLQELFSTIADTTNNWLSVSLGSRLSGEDQTTDTLKTEQRYVYATITTATTTVIKSGAGFLHRITVTGGTTGTVVVWDNISAATTKISDFDTTNSLASYEFNIAFTTGLTIVTSAATKLTISYR